MGQLILWEAVLRNSREATPMAPLRLLQISGHAGSRRELVFVGKEVMRPSRSSLDSRGSFVLHCPAQKKAFMWIGAECPERFIHGAEKLCRQLKAFLAVEAISEERQGAESEGFWAALKDCPGPIGHVGAFDGLYQTPVPGRVYRFAVWDVVSGAIPGGASALRDEAKRQAWVSFESRNKIAVWVPGDGSGGVPFAVRQRDGKEDIVDPQNVVEFVGRSFINDVGLSEASVAFVQCTDSDPLVSIAVKSSTLS